MSDYQLMRGQQLVLSLVNKSGGARAEGDLVIFSAAAAESFTTTTTLQDHKVIGVVAETIADNARGRIVCGGYVPILTVADSPAKGAYLYASTTAAKACTIAGLAAGVFGIALTDEAGGEVAAWICPHLPYPVPGEFVLWAREGGARTDTPCAGPTLTELGSVNHIDAYVFGFDKDADEFAQWSEMVMPADYDGGTITAQFVWTCAAGDGGGGETVCFALRGRCFADDEAIDQALGAAQAVTDIWIADLDVHITAVTSAITLAGTPAAGELVVFEVQRDISEDDLGGDALLLSVLITYTRLVA